MTFTIQDTGAPTLEVAPVHFVDCELYDPTAVYSASASDLCGDATVVLVSVNEVSSSCAGQYLHVYKAVDDCGNESGTLDQVVTLVDEVNPVPSITCPANTDLFTDENCNADTSVEANGSATGSATDNCDDAPSVAISHEDVVTPGCTGSYSIARTWKAIATDHCGNQDSTTCVQTITVTDNIAPVPSITCPAAYTVDADENCNADTTPAAAGTATATATDNCDGTITGLTTTTLPITTSTTITWSYTDIAGNSNTQTQEVVIQGIVPELEDGTSFSKCADGEVDLYVNITNDPNMDNTYVYDWSINGVLVSEGDTSGTFTHGEAYGYDSVLVVVSDANSNCSSETTITIDSFMNENCMDIPQGISPNGDGLNDCLVLDHLEAQEDIIKAEVYNRYGVKVFELNDYIDQWCGQDASGGNINSNGLLPIGTYFYVIQYASDREPTISWIYLNY